MFDSTTIPVVEQVVRFAQARHGVLAGNIANLDTPGYRVRDLSPEAFEQRLKKAIDQSESSGVSQSFGEASFAPRQALDEVAESTQSILYHDDSNVSLEHQVAEISKNQAQHNLALTILRSQFQLLETAISERIL